MRTRPIDYTIEARRELVLIEYQEDAGFEEWSAVMQAVLGDADYRPGFHFLVDRRRADAVAPTDLSRMVAFIGDRAEDVAGSRWAIVVSSLADYGMARMTQKLAEDHPTTLQIFSDRDDGIRWLLEPDSDEDR